MNVTSCPYRGIVERESITITELSRLPNEVYNPVLSPTGVSSVYSIPLKYRLGFNVGFCEEDYQQETLKAEVSKVNRKHQINFDNGYNLELLIRENSLRLKK